MHSDNLWKWLFLMFAMPDLFSKCKQQHSRGVLVWFIFVFFDIFSAFFFLVWLQGMFRTVSPQLLTSLPHSVCATGNLDVEYNEQNKAVEKKLNKQIHMKRVKRSSLVRVPGFMVLRESLDSLCCSISYGSVSQFLCRVSWDLVTHWSEVSFKDVYRWYWTPYHCFLLIAWFS